MILLNKSDLLDEAALAAARADIAEHMRPAVKVVPTRHGAVDAAVRSPSAGTPPRAARPEAGSRRRALTKAVLPESYNVV